MYKVPINTLEESRDLLKKLIEMVDAHTIGDHTIIARAQDHIKLLEENYICPK